MSLTTEELRKQFKSNFELVLYVIDYAKYEMKAGREVTLDYVLNLVRRHPNPSYLEDLKAIDAATEDE
jgi:RNase adaptor protein for sRNA GlmZ degradation